MYFTIGRPKKNWQGYWDGVRRHSAEAVVMHFETNGDALIEAIWRRFQDFYSKALTRFMSPASIT